MDSGKRKSMIKFPVDKNHDEKNVIRKKSQPILRQRDRIPSAETVTAATKPGRKSSSTQAQAAQEVNSRTFTDAVNKHYLNKPLLRRFSRCGLSPGSDEFKCVMQDFKGEEETIEELNLTTTPARRSKSRKISFNDFGRGRKSDATDLSLEFQVALSLRPPRPRLNTLPGRISEMTISGKTDQTRAKEKTTDQDKMAVYPNAVRLAWQNREDHASLPLKKKVQRNVSLPNPPKSFYFENKLEGRDLHGAVTQPSERDITSGTRLSGRVRRKNGITEVFESEKGVLSDIWQNKGSNNKTTVGESRRHVSAGEPIKWAVTTGQSLREDDSWLSLYPQRERAHSDERITVGKEAAKMNRKFFYSMSQSDDSISRSHELPLILDSTESENSSRNWGQKMRGSTQASSPRANLRRFGKAALVATRLLKIHYRENGGKKTETHRKKTLDELFEDMKDCRYLRKENSLMETNGIL